MAFQFELPSLAAIPAHVAGEKKWNCFQLFCAWQRPMVTAALEEEGEEAEFSAVTKELKRCWKSQSEEHVVAYQAIAKLLPLSLEDIERLRREHAKEIAAEENCDQQNGGRTEKGITRKSDGAIAKTIAEPLQEKKEKREKREKREPDKEERKEKREKKERKRERKERKEKEKRKEEEREMSSRSGEREKTEQKKTKVEQKEKKEEKEEEEKATKTEDRDRDRERERISCVERLREERAEQLLISRKRKEEAALVAKQERELTRKQIQEAKCTLERERDVEMTTVVDDEELALRQRAELEEARRQREELETLQRWREEEERHRREAEERARVHSQQLEIEQRRAAMEKQRFEAALLSEQSRARAQLESRQQDNEDLRAQLEAERRQRKQAEERARALQRKFDLDLKKLTAMFNSNLDIGGKSSVASRIVNNAAVKRVLHMANRFHHSKKINRNSTAPVFIIIDTNSLEKKVLHAWARGHSSSQYQQNVSAGLAPLVNGVIPMAVLREVDFYNKEGSRNVGSLQGILESQFQRFNQDQPCFLHPQSVDQVYRHNSREAKPINEDEHILSCCLFFRDHYNGCEVWLATKDRNLRLKALANRVRADRLKPMLSLAQVPLHLK